MTTLPTKPRNSVMSFACSLAVFAPMSTSDFAIEVLIRNTPFGVFQRPFHTMACRTINFFNLITAGCKITRGLVVVLLL